MELGSRIAAWRRSRGISQRQLAKKIGLTSSAVSQIEADLFAPTQDTLQGIVSALGLTMHKFYGRVPKVRA